MNATRKRGRPKKQKISCLCGCGKFATMPKKQPLFASLHCGFRFGLKYGIAVNAEGKRQQETIKFQNNRKKESEIPF